MITIQPTTDQLKEAKRLATEMGAIKNSVMSGQRNFVGFVGEVVVRDLLKCQHKSNKDYDMVLEDGRTVDVKTFSSRMAPQPSFDCNIMKSSTHQKCDMYIFSGYNKDQNKLYVCGYVPREEYYSKAVFRKKGAKDPKNGIIYRSDSYSIPVGYLLPIEDLL